MNEFRRRTDSVLPSVERRQKAHAINLTIFTGFCMEENYSTFRKLGQYYAMQISCTTVKHLKEYYKFRANTCNSKRVMSDRWNSKSIGKCPPYADPLSVVPHQSNFACVVVSRMSFLVSSFIKIGWKMCELWGSKFRPSHWLGTSLIQQLVATAQAVVAQYKVLSSFCHNGIKNTYL